MVNIRYWHTRSSTIGISRFATVLLAVSTLGKYFLANLSSYNLKKQLLITLFAAIANLPLELSPFLMLKAIWRIEFGWNQKKGKGSKWTEKGMKKRRCEVPVPSVTKATHAERTSDRLDARTPWTVKLSVSIYYVLRDSQSVSYSRDIFYASSLYHAALPISSSHLQLPSFSFHLTVSIVKLKSTRSSPSLNGRSLLQGSL